MLWLKKLFLKKGKVKLFVENLLSLKPAEFWFRGINTLPDKWQKRWFKIIVKIILIEINSLLNYSWINYSLLKLFMTQPYIYRERGRERDASMLTNADDLLRRCPWCNCYRRRKWTRRHEFKSWTRLIAFHIALIPLGKVWIQLFSFQLWVNSRTD